MTSLAERQRIVGNIVQACETGATLQGACQVAGISLNCWYRWQQDGTVLPDRRPQTPRPEPANKLSAAERSQILAVCNSARFGSLPPSQIVPLLADEGVTWLRNRAFTGCCGKLDKPAGVVGQRCRVPRSNRPAIRPLRPTRSGRGM